jgi:hypothetical protein
MYRTGLTFCGGSLLIEAPDALRADLEVLFGRPKRPKNLDEIRRIVVREDGEGGFSIDAPFNKSASSLDQPRVLTRLLEEVVRSLVFELESRVALHAGAVGWGNKLALVAGPSGVGKSSFVAWLAANGFDYLSDELVALTEEGDAEAFLRPLVVKPGSRQLVSDLSLEGEAIDIGDNLAINLGDGLIISQPYTD